MGIEDLIYVEENIMSAEALSSFIKWLNKMDQEFQKAGVVAPQTKEGQIINEEKRKVKQFNLTLDSPSQTKVHWCNFFGKIIFDFKNRYEQKIKTNCLIQTISEINVLKYENSGHYDFHTDHCYSIPRTLSVIILLNDDYKGGDLVFKDFNKNSELLRVQPSSARAIIWPSNFMYPHRVEPITEGKRYSVVSWLL